MTQIIKRRGHKQKFDERKLYASIYAGCLSANIEKEEAAATSNLVVRELNRWLDEKKEITSNQIFSKVGLLLKAKYALRLNTPTGWRISN